MEIDRALEVLQEAGIEYGIIRPRYYLGENITVVFTVRQIIAIAEAIELSM